MIVAVLFGVYLAAIVLSWISERWMIPAVHGGEGAFRITLRHFQQPDTWGISPEGLGLFLGRVKQGRSGSFALEWLYGGLLGVYLVLSTLLVRLVSIGSKEPEDETNAGGGIDFVLRYTPIINRLRPSGVKDPSILEIGPWTIGLATFLKECSVIGIDERVTAPKTNPKNLKMVQASALNAPFPDNSFDYVVCVDVLEHVAPGGRHRLIQEALRVTKNTLFIATPCGTLTASIERLVYSLLAPIYRLFHKDLSFLSEHIENGLAKEEDLLRHISLCVPDASVSVLGNVNLAVWILCMGLDPLIRRMTKRIGIVYLHRLLAPIAPLLNIGPVYRRVFIVSKAV